mgnify:CR=1 FL=1
MRNDILLCKNGTYGICALVETDEIFDIYVSLALMRPKKEYLPKYLVYAINNPITKEQFNIIANIIDLYMDKEEYFNSTIRNIYYELEDILKVENIPKYFDEEGIKPELIYELFSDFDILDYFSKILESYLIILHPFDPIVYYQF